MVTKHFSQVGLATRQPLARINLHVLVSYLIQIRISLFSVRTNALIIANLNPPRF